MIPVQRRMGWRLHGLQAVGRAKIRTQNAPSTKRSSFLTLRGVGLGCYAEPKQGGLVRPVAKICFMLRPLYGLCDSGYLKLYQTVKCSIVVICDFWH
jgi:hypothetical protein